MICPECGTDGSKVVDTRMMLGGKRRFRRRECGFPACGVRYNTVEVYAGTAVNLVAHTEAWNEAINASISKLRELKRKP